MSTSASRYSCPLKARFLIAAIFMVGWTTTPALTVGQLPDSLSADTRVSILTQLPGEPIYAVFAHTAFRFRDETTGVDLVFNYGTFDTTIPYFVPRFAYGEMDYYLSVYGMRLFMRAAAQENRSVIEQTLRMSPEHTARLYERLRIQARPENRTYRYDFLHENCSTIMLDLLRETEGVALRFDSTAVGPTTYRQLLQPYLEHRPFWDLGIDLALGARVDRDVTYFERAFLPMELMRIAGAATTAETVAVGDTVSVTGNRPTAPFVSFVTRTDTLLWVGQGFSEQGAIPWLAIIIWIAVIGLIAFGHMRPKRRSVTFRADRWFFGILGFLGLFLTFMWFGTLHYVTETNWNILWALPTHILVAIGWRRFGSTFVSRYFFANAVLVALLLIFSFATPQHYHSVFYPVMLLIAWRSWRVGTLLKTHSRHQVR